MNTLHVQKGWSGVSREHALPHSVHMNRIRHSSPRYQIMGSAMVLLLEHQHYMLEDSAVRRRF